MPRIVLCWDAQKLFGMAPHLFIVTFKGVHQSTMWPQVLCWDAQKQIVLDPLCLYFYILVQVLHYGCSLSGNVTQRFLLRYQDVNYAGSLSLIWIIVLPLWGYTNKSLNWDAKKQIVLSPICLLLIFVAFMVVHWFVDVTANRVDAQKQFVLMPMLLVLFVVSLFILTTE